MDCRRPAILKILEFHREHTVLGHKGGFQRAKSFEAEGLPSFSISSIVGKFASSWDGEIETHSKKMKKPTKYL